MSTTPPSSPSHSSLLVQKGELSLEKKGLTGKSWSKVTVSLYSSGVLQISGQNTTCLTEDPTRFVLDIAARTNNNFTLHVQTKKFKFKCGNVADVDSWILAFRSFGIKIIKIYGNEGRSLLGSFQEDTSEEVDDITPYLGFTKKQDVKTWTQEDVQNWLSFIHVDYKETCITVGLGYVFQQLNVDGEALHTISLRNLYEHFRISTTVLLHFSAECKNILHGKPFSPNRYKMIKKFAKNATITDKFSFKDLYDLKILKLHDVEQVKSLIPLEDEYYEVESSSSDEEMEELTEPRERPSHKAQRTFSNGVPSEEKKERQKYQSVGSPIAFEKADVVTTPRHKQHGKTESTTIQYHAATTTVNSPEDTASSTESKVPGYLKTYQLKVKLVLTEIPSIPVMVRNILRSPVVNLASAAVPDSGNFWGFFHSALIIGPFYLEWVCQEWCYPKGARKEKWSSSNALFVGDIGVVNIQGEEQLDDFKTSICSLIVDWNVNYSYRPACALKKEFNGNCQDYVQAALKTIQKYYTPFNNQIVEEFLNTMKTYGTVTPTFRPSEEFREKFDIKEKKIRFATHKELDDFVTEVGKKCSAKGCLFDEAYPGEYLLLKAWDRSFWLRFNSNQKSAKYAQCNCPFGDPEATVSFAL